MKKSSLLVNRLFLIFGILCIVYYIGMGVTIRFGQSLLWIWALLGIVCLTRYFLAKPYIMAGKPFPISRKLRRAIHIVICLGLALFLFLEGFIVAGAFHAAPAGLDCLVVLGARVNEDGPSGALNERIETAAAYLLANPDTIAVASGGQGGDEPMSEAQCIREHLIAAGVAAERILLEDKSADTAENLRNSFAIVGDRVKTVGIVTSDFHIFRSLAVARKMGSYEFYGVPAQSSVFGFIHYAVREVPAVLVEGMQGNLDFMG